MQPMGEREEKTGNHHFQGERIRSHSEDERVACGKHMIRNCSKIALVSSFPIEGD